MTIPDALRYLKTFNGKITRQQFKTIRGQILAGDMEAAMRGLDKLTGGRYETRITL